MKFKNFFVSATIFGGLMLGLTAKAQAQNLTDYNVYDAKGNIVFTVKPKANESKDAFEKRAKKEAEAYKKQREKDNEIVSLADYKIYDEKGNTIVVIKPKEGESLEAFEKRAKKEGEDALRKAQQPVRDTTVLAERTILDPNGNIVEVVKPKPGEKKEDFDKRANQAAAEAKNSARQAGSKKDIIEELTETYTILYGENGEELQKVYQKKGESNKDFKKRVAKIGEGLANKKAN